LKWIQRAHDLATGNPDKVSVLYADEFSYYRSPLLSGGGVYSPQGEEPTFEQIPGYNTRQRVGGTLDAYTGRVVWVDGKLVGTVALCRLLERVRQAYGPERTLFLIWDNWHVHYQADVATKAAELNIQMLWLPTYAPWTNPIEKLWRWLKQTHIHNHQLADDFDTLKSRVSAFLSSFKDGSTELLRYVGLLPHPSITRLSC
jgi:putative transposase